MAKRKAKHKNCDCAEKQNATLNEQGLQLDSRFISRKNEKGELAPVTLWPLIAVQKVDAKNRKVKIKPLACRYCPGCGKKLEW